jgi:hypothetical protein
MHWSRTVATVVTVRFADPQPRIDPFLSDVENSLLLTRASRDLSLGELVVEAIER